MWGDAVDSTRTRWVFDYVGTNISIRYSAIKQGCCCRCGALHSVDVYTVLTPCRLDLARERALRVEVAEWTWDSDHILRIRSIRRVYYTPEMWEFYHNFNLECMSTAVGRVNSCTIECMKETKCVSDSTIFSLYHYIFALFVYRNTHVFTFHYEPEFWVHDRKPFAWLKMSNFDNLQYQHKSDKSTLKSKRQVTNRIQCTGLLSIQC